MNFSYALKEEFFGEEEARSMSHKALDEWFDAQLAPLFKQGKPPTVGELSQIFQDTKQQLLSKTMQVMIEELYDGFLHQETANCPKCDKSLKRKRFDDKNISTLQGPFHISRPYFHCDRCHFGFHPIDKELELARGKHQYDIQAEATRLAADLPFQRSSEHLKRLAGVDAGNHFSHETLNAVGETAKLEDVIPSLNKTKKKIAKIKGKGKWRPVMVISADGAYSPVRPPGKRREKRGAGAWQDTKGVRIYLVGKGNRIVHIASWHQIEDAQAFTVELKRIAKRIPQDDVRIALIGDGADWLWNQGKRMKFSHKTNNYCAYL